MQLTSGPTELLHVTPVATLQERVYQVFGSQALEDLVEIGARREASCCCRPTRDDAAATRAFRLSGFFSRPAGAEGQSQFDLHLRERPADSRPPADARALLGVSQPDAAGVLIRSRCCSSNAIPKRSTSTFTRRRPRCASATARFVHDFVRDTLRERLMEIASGALVLAGAARRSPTPQPGAALPYSEFSQMIENEVAAGAARTMPPRRRRDRAAGRPAGVRRCGPRPVPRRASTSPRRRSRSRPARRLPASCSATSTRTANFPPDAIPAPEFSLSVLSELRPLGQIHESFIIAAGRDGLWIIDQHVAHERILFEQVMKQRAAGRVEMQRLLMPLIVQLTAEQQIDYARIADELHASGFETEPFGNRTIAIKAAPAAVGARGAGEDPLRNSGDRRERAARRLARRSAPQYLRLDRLPRRHQDQHAARRAPRWSGCCARSPQTDCPMSCPHGRPIALHYSTREILKAFHRI